MPKNKGKGGKNCKKGKKSNKEKDDKRELIFREDGQEYTQDLRMLGNRRLEALCDDGIKRLCHIRGKMHKKVWINAGITRTIKLTSSSNILADEARLLKAYGELSDNVKLNAGIDDKDGDAGDDYFKFALEDDEQNIDKI
ncbi:hypothetical protein JCGZ_00729 [Jatropha curcas]|uniref:S1-like domain-containing protein n=1 Tax=Jatropha curcas TaxID=180498 RepID=A0A067KS60_JATCU|nr:hypothetical protein JCGZ_00729 [Jatropha curcas]